MQTIVLKSYQSTDNEPVVTTIGCLPYHPPLDTGLVTNPSGSQSGTEFDNMMPDSETLFHHAGSTHPDAISQTADSLAADHLQVVSKARRFSTHGRHSNPCTFEFTNPCPSREMEPSNSKRKDLLPFKSGDKRNFLQRRCHLPNNNAPNRREATFLGVIQHISFFGSGLLTSNTPRKCKKHNGEERSLAFSEQRRLGKSSPSPLRTHLSKSFTSP